ncbi:MAG: hypothetical protein WA020_09995 [Candidatus Acidiferrales bacterium]
MSVASIVRKVESAGIAFRLDGEKVRVRYPSEERREELAGQIALLRDQRAEVAAYLKIRSAIPPMPDGVGLIRWEPKAAPVLLARFAVVTDVTKFISTTLLELKAALAGERWLSGNWSVRELQDRLEQCGVVVQIGEAKHADRGR